MVKNPYIRLLGIAQQYVYSMLHRKRISMFFYPKDKIGSGWNLSDLYERTAAANQLGYDVELKAEERGLVVEYVKRPDNPPYPLN